MVKNVLSEKEAREKVAKLEIQLHVRFSKFMRKKAIESYMGKREWFEQ